MSVVMTEVLQTTGKELLDNVTKARAEQLNVNVLGIGSDVHIQDGEVELSMTTEISLTLLPVSDIAETTAVK